MDAEMMKTMLKVIQKAAMNRCTVNSEMNTEETDALQTQCIILLINSKIVITSENRYH